jgi:hypothetical protein
MSIKDQDELKVTREKLKWLEKEYEAALRNPSVRSSSGAIRLTDVFAGAPFEVGQSRLTTTSPRVRLTQQWLND